jgi:hypothetical protein
MQMATRANADCARPESFERVIVASLSSRAVHVTGVHVALGIRTLAGPLILRERVIKPVLAGARAVSEGPSPTPIAPLDLHYLNLQREMHRTFQALALAA